MNIELSDGSSKANEKQDTRIQSKNKDSESLSNGVETSATQNGTHTIGGIDNPSLNRQDDIELQ